MFFSTAITAPSPSIQPTLPVPTTKHQQHQRPAAADAVKAVIPAEPPGAAPRLRPLPPLGDKAERRAAFVEAAIFQTAELKETGDGKDRRADGPAIEHQPLRLPDAGMHGGI